MTSSPGLRGWSRLQAGRGVLLLQTSTDDDNRRQRAKQFWPIRRASNNTLVEGGRARTELWTRFLRRVTLLGAAAAVVIFTPSLSDSAREEITFSGCPSAAFVLFRPDIYYYHDISRTPWTISMKPTANIDWPVHVDQWSTHSGARVTSTYRWRHVTMT